MVERFAMKILYIEDELIDFKAFKRSIKGHEVSWMPRIKYAAHLAEANLLDYDLLIVDYSNTTLTTKMFVPLVERVLRAKELPVLVVSGCVIPQDLPFDFCIKDKMVEYVTENYLDKE